MQTIKPMRIFKFVIIKIRQQGGQLNKPIGGEVANWLKDVNDILWWNLCLSVWWTDGVYDNAWYDDEPSGGEVQNWTGVYVPPSAPSSNPLT